jgi:Xaa-Pro aminopeptidase
MRALCATKISTMIEDEIYEYLNAYADSSLRNPAPATIAILRKNPKESFSVIADYSGRQPNKLDPRDLNEPLGRLLLSITDLIPDLLISRMTSGFWASRYLFIGSAAASKADLFVPTIVDLLSDRSIYVKNLVLSLIVQYPHLQVPETLPKFEKLSRMQSYKNDYDRQHLEKAMTAVAKAHNKRMQSDAAKLRR